MDFSFGEMAFATEFVEDKRHGWSGLELYRTDGTRVRVARVVLWEASGQFSVETLGTDIPLGVMERVVDEAKARVSED